MNDFYLNNHINYSKKLRITYLKKKQKKDRNQSVTSRNSKYSLEYLAKQNIITYRKLNEQNNKLKRLKNNKNLQAKSKFINLSKNQTKKLSLKNNIPKSKYPNNLLKLYSITRKILLKHFFSLFMDLSYSFRKKFNFKSSFEKPVHIINLKKIKNIKNCYYKELLDDLYEDTTTRETKLNSRRSTKHQRTKYHNIISYKNYSFPDNTLRIIKNSNSNNLYLSNNNTNKIPKNLSNNIYELLKFIFNKKNISSKDLNISHNSIYNNKRIKKFDSDVINASNEMNFYIDNDINKKLYEIIINKKWIHLPMIIIKFVFLQNIKKYGKKFLNNLYIINQVKINEIKRNKLFHCLKIINNKILKHFFRLYRDNILISKVQLLLIQNNKKIKHKKIKHSIDKKAKLFINKNTKLYNYKEKFELLKSKIYFLIKNKKKFFFILLKNILLKSNISYAKNRELSVKIDDKFIISKVKKNKKYIRIKMASKSTNSHSKRSNYSENSKKSKESNILLSPRIKKMNIEKRIISKITSWNNDDDNVFFIRKINNIMINNEKRELMKCFKAWKKLKDEK